MSGTSFDSKASVGLANSLSNVFKLVSYNWDVFENYMKGWVVCACVWFVWCVCVHTPWVFFFFRLS